MWGHSVFCFFRECEDEEEEEEEENEDNDRKKRQSSRWRRSRHEDGRTGG